MAREIWNDSMEQPWYQQRLPMEGRYTFLPLRDTQPGLEGSVFNEREWALPGLLAEVVNAFTAPGRSLLDPTFNAPEEAANVALNVGGGGLLASRALPSPAGGVDLGMFAGRKSKTADLDALETFYDLDVEGVVPAKSYQKTGWMYGAEGLPKYEISDVSAKILPEFMAKPADMTETVLGNVLSHPDLYKAYPELKDTKFLISDKTPLAAYSRDQNTLLVNPKVIDEVVTENNPQRLKNILLHEVQHNVQKIEGFERGGSTAVAKSILEKQKEADMSPLMTQINQMGNDEKSAILNRNIFDSALKKLEKKENKSQDDINEMSELRFLLEKTQPLANKYKQTVSKYRKLEKLDNEELYERIAGEAEARLTQARQFIPDYERRQEFPFKQLDVPYNELLYRSLLD